MATAPITQSTPGKIRTFLLDHERLILVLIVAALVWYGIGKYQDIRAAHDNSVLAAAKLATDAQLKTNAAVLAQKQADDATRAVLQSKIEAQNVQLIAANTQLASALASRQHVDLELPLPDLAVRWNQLVPAATPTATPGGLGIDQRGAVATVVALEQIPALQSELTNETQLKANDDQLLTAANIGISDRDKQIGGLLSGARSDSSGTGVVPRSCELATDRPWCHLLQQRRLP